MHRFCWLTGTLAVFVFLINLQPSSADTPTENELLFARRIAPLLIEKCVACHGADPSHIQGGLDLRSTEGAAAGGDSGQAAFARGNAAHSPMFQAAVRQSSDWSAMPPKEAEALTSTQLNWLKQWIDGGASWPKETRVAEIAKLNYELGSDEDGVRVKTSGGLDDNWTDRRYDPAGLWAYQPVVKPQVDQQSQSHKSKFPQVSSIDQLLDLRRPEGLSAAPLATRAQLLRRATFDLTGLPPTDEQTQAFFGDPRDDLSAFADVVDSLLTAPHYGERMAQHWLDVVRYADSSGFANDYDRGNAWRYRDYVIRSFNADKPLTTRAIVNRIWMWHFGIPIAGNPNNFGASGKRPTHPELLDWLAASFVENQWSFKQLHRRIMLSHAYRQSSTHPDFDLIEKLDPLRESNSVFQRRRLTAEELRDAMLFASGELNPTVGGIPCRPVPCRPEINEEVALQPRQVMGTFAAAWTPNPKPQDRHRRSIYVLKLRGVTVPMFEVFNVPGPDFSCEQRSSSTVTPQVFTLFNGRNSYSRALSLALDLNPHPVQMNIDRADVTNQAFARLFSRQPTSNEQSWCIAHWKDMELIIDDRTIELAQKPQRPPTKIRRTAIEENTGERFSFDENLYANFAYVPDHNPRKINRQTLALADVCLALFNTNEFAYVD